MHCVREFVMLREERETLMPRGIDLDLSSGFKTCPKCLIAKSLKNYHKSKSTVGGYQVYCKSCQGERHNKWRLQNLPKMREVSKKWRAENPRLAKDHILKSRYGVPIGWYELTLAEQEGKCASCKTNDPGGKGDFHVDHCHDLGHVRGLLCHNCNVGIGSLQHSVPMLEAAIQYLIRTLPRTPTEILSS